MNEDAIQSMHDGWDLLIGQANIIAMLPLEDWLAAFERAETLGPILDPTLYRQYIYDPEKKGEVIKDIINAALPLKHAILKARKIYEERAAKASTR